MGRRADIDISSTVPNRVLTGKSRRKEEEEDIDISSTVPNRLLTGKCRRTR